MHGVPKKRWPGLRFKKKFFNKKVRKSKKEGQFVLPTFNFGRMNWPPSFFFDFLTKSSFCYK